MKNRLCRLEFGVSSLADIRTLYKAWDSLWALEGWEDTESKEICLTVDDRLPGEEVILNFYATPEVLDKYLGFLEQGGLKFSCDATIPGFLIMCRVEHECF